MPSAGTKILSFNDSPWLIDQLELGLLRKGGDYKSAQCLINIAGLSLYILDNYPREILGILVRDVQIYKPMGSIEATAKIRLFQVDAMLPNCRYPCIIQPKSIGVDRRGHIENNLMKEARPASIDESECFWMHTNDDQPVFEGKCKFDNVHALLLLLLCGAWFVALMCFCFVSAQKSN